MVGLLNAWDYFSPDLSADLASPVDPENVLSSPAVLYNGGRFTGLYDIAGTWHLDRLELEGMKFDSNRVTSKEIPIQHLPPRTSATLFGPRAFTRKGSN